MVLGTETPEANASEATTFDAGIPGTAPRGNDPRAIPPTTHGNGSATRFARRNLAAETDRWTRPEDSGLRESVRAFLVAFVIMAPALGFEAYAAYGIWRDQNAHESVLEAPALPVLPIGDAAHGRDLYADSCIACHGADARGLTGMGKNLRVSDFVAMQSDDQLAVFLAEGRPDAKPMAMPPRAGRPELTDEDLRHLVTYLRGLQDPRRMPALPAPVVNKAPSEAQKAAALAAAGGDAELAGYIASGDRIFHSLCVACHGKGGVGIAGNGKALVNNEFVHSIDDDALLAFVKQGRAPTDPKNTTGIQMPPKGGNPAMSDDDILDVIAYLRTLKGNARGAAKGT
jgi:disulfide bond formation protein DsbB